MILHVLHHHMRDLTQKSHFTINSFELTATSHLYRLLLKKCNFPSFEENDVECVQHKR